MSWHVGLRKDLSCRYKILLYPKCFSPGFISVHLFGCGQLNDSRMGAEVGVGESELLLSASVVVRLATHAVNHNFCNTL